jgi:hypothetical protein
MKNEMALRAKEAEWMPLKYALSGMVQQAVDRSGN